MVSPRLGCSGGFLGETGIPLSPGPNAGQAAASPPPRKGGEGIAWRRLGDGWGLLLLMGLGGS